MTDVAGVYPKVSDVVASRSGGEPWLVVWTRPRAERRVAELLESKGVTSWLPTMPVRRRWSDRWKTVQEPLFPSYVFAQHPEPDWGFMLHVSGVLTLVKTGGRPARLREWQMASLRRASERIAFSPDEFEVEAYHVGDWVRVVSGPMIGLAGVVREVRGRRRLLIGFEAVGRALSVSIGTADVEPLTGSDNIG